jgi:hypothetical protein
MNYTVQWTPTAEQDLAAVWIAAADRDVITSTANIIDALLHRDPERLGEVLFDTVRTMAVPPLGVEFEVIEEDRIVYVLSVWQI